MVHAQTLLSRADTPGPVQQQEARSFWSYVFSQRFAWHLVWLSVIQLWHYLFIGTLNNLLTKLAVGDRDLGICGAGRLSVSTSQLGTWNLEGAGR